MHFAKGSTLLTLALLAAVLAAPSPTRGQQGPPPPATPPAAVPLPPPPAPASPPADVKRAVYLPESAKQELKDELKKEILAQAEREGWAAPRQIPEWLKRLRLEGDVRTRYEAVVLPDGNANAGEFPDFNAINTGRPFDVNFLAYANERYLNVDRDRARARLRGRVGLTSDLGRHFEAGLRLATGDSPSPASTNQTQGTAIGRLPLSADRVWIRWAPGGSMEALQVAAGRVANPFLTTDLVWDDDVNLDGAFVRGEVKMGGLAPFLVAGVFPIQTTSFSFPAERTAKFPTVDKFLYAAQLGAGWQPVPAFSVKLGAAWYHYRGVMGKKSGPCNTHLADVSCDTDDTRPLFAQKGNTYMALRTPSEAALAAEAAGFAPRFQYFGLATRFHELAVTARADVALGGAVRIGISGEWVKNLAFDRSKVEGRALNNLGPCLVEVGTDAGSTEEGCGAFDGGDQGYQGRVSIGSTKQDEAWAWSASFGYRHLESDATLDAFADSDFGAGGTNVEGITAALSLAFSPRVVASARWMSADAIAGPTYRADTAQLDLTARF